MFRPLKWPMDKSDPSNTTNPVLWDKTYMLVSSSALGFLVLSQETVVEIHLPVPNRCEVIAKNTRPIVKDLAELPVLRS